MSRRHKNRGCIGCTLFIIFLAAILYLSYTFIAPYLESLALKIQKIQYPVKYQQIVEKYSEKYDLDKYLVYSIIKTESNFDSYAVSKVGAKGLMQITDKTGSDCAKKLEIKGYNENSLFEPEINIQIGCYYLSYLIKNYKNKDTAVAAYNGGMGNVNEWLKNPKYSDKDANLINIPFKETRNYVIRVKNAEQKYINLYEE